MLQADDEQRSLTLRITESGGERPAAVGSVMTYYIPEDASFEVEATVDSILYRAYREPTLSQITAGDTVLIDFEEINARPEMKRVRQEEPQNAEVREQIQRSFAAVDPEPVETESIQEASSRTELPKTASAMPYIPAFAVLFLVLAMIMRLSRRALN